jgi:hypothetical protein
MRLSVRRAPARIVIAPIFLLASACFEGGEYRGGGRRIEDPGFADVAEDASDDAANEDAPAETSDAHRDAALRDDGDVDAATDGPRGEPPPELEDAGSGEPDGLLPDATPVDVMAVDARADAPPSGPDATDPKDAGADVPIRDAPVERRD